MWTIFKVFIELVTIVSVFVLVFWPQGMWDALAPGPGMDPVPPALEGEVLTTGLPGKSQKKHFKEQSNFIHPGTKTNKKNTKPNAHQKESINKNQSRSKWRTDHSDKRSANTRAGFLER